MFTDKDLQLFAQKGIDIKLIDSQIRKFEEGFPFVNLTAAAVNGNGIVSFNQKQVADYIDYYDKYATHHSVIKFVPASGAASRMFKDLFEFREALMQGESLDTILGDEHYSAARAFVNGLTKFAFFPFLKKVLKDDGIEVEALIEKGQFITILDYVLTDKGLNYANKPKALLLFHQYGKNSRFAMEEHLVEGVEYAKNNEEEVKIHFTVSPEHKPLFEKELNKAMPMYAAQFNVSFEISFSEQKKATDTIAVDLNNDPFREDDGSILFRPAGHGALIENLNDLDTQIVFIKNIDNVVPDSLREPTYEYKKVIGTHLLKLQNKTFEYLEMLDNSSFIEEDLDEMIKFIEDDLLIKIINDFNTFATIEKVDYLYSKMNRPIRVCGMVRNEGEPGGGPFWVQNDDKESLQIVEGSQIDLENKKQKEILDSATHFNPVDLVCGLRDYKNMAFDLTKFVDPNTGFISQKSKNGQSLKAQELPGLWNGAMADWITIFVEVPIETFNPVKSVNDLLKQQHSST